MLDAEYMIGYALSKYDRGWADGALHVVEYGMDHDPRKTKSGF